MSKVEQYLNTLCGKSDCSDSAGAFGAVKSSMTHISGFHRSQVLLLPEAVEDYVGSDNPVRFIDAFVDGLDLAAAGFARVAPAAAASSSSSSSSI